MHAPVTSSKTRLRGLNRAERIGMFKLTWPHVKSVLWRYRGTIALMVLVSVVLGFVPTIKSELESALINQISDTIRGRNPGQLVSGSGGEQARPAEPPQKSWAESTREVFSIRLGRFADSEPRPEEDLPIRIARVLFGQVNVGWALLVYLALSLCAYAVDFATTVLQTKVSREVFSRLRAVGLSRGLVTEPSQLPAMSNVAGQYSSAIQVGAANVGNTYGYLLDGGQHFLSLSTALFLVFTKSRPFALACLLIVALQVCLSYSQGRRLRRRRNEFDARRNDLLARTDDVLSKREIILAYEQQGHYGDKLEDYTRGYAEVGRSLDIRQKLYELSSRLVTDYGRMIILLVGLLVTLGVSRRGGAQVSDIGDAYFFISIYTRILFPATDLLRKYDNLKESESTSRTFLAVLSPEAAQPAVSAQPQTQAKQNHDRSPVENDTIKFRDVYFKYPSPADQSAPSANDTDEKWVLRGCSFRVPARKTTLVLGRSGCGKTTIARILLGFWRPLEGQVTIGEHDLSTYSSDELRAMMAYVSQGDHVIDDTVRENLRWGYTRDGRPIADERMLTVLQDLGITRTPQEREEILKKLARDLSGGQQQRLSFARMMLDESDIVILDEPFAGVDIFTLRDLRPHLERVFDGAGRTVLMFSHRLAFAAYADHVIVFGDDGRIIEEGSPAELLKQESTFAQLYTAARAELSFDTP